MYTRNEQADIRKCFPALDDLPIRKTFSISRIIGILYRFRDIRNEQTAGVVHNAYESIRKHIRGYSQASQRCSSYNPDKSICDICSFAAELISGGSIDYVRQNKIIDLGYRFQKEWLSNMGLLIPLEPRVIEILPFLLLCYTANAPYNKLDPFRGLGVDRAGEEVSDATVGWLEVFPDFQAENSISTAPDAGNLKRSIRHLAEYCTRWPPKLPTPKYSSLLNSESAVASNSCPESGNHEFQTTKDKFLQAIRNWELYRRFAAFCDACDTYERLFKEPKFNLTLSMALFAQFWNFDDINLEEYPDDQELIQPITWEDTEADRLHEEIVDATRLREGEDYDTIDIHGIVREMKAWFLKSYSVASPYSPLVFSQSIDLDSDALQ